MTSAMNSWAGSSHSSAVSRTSEPGWPALRAGFDRHVTVPALDGYAVTVGTPRRPDRAWPGRRTPSPGGAPRRVEEWSSTSRAATARPTTGPLLHWGFLLVW